jgi:XrtJ-associated TM-motif-TM protein
MSFTIHNKRGFPMSLPNAAKSIKYGLPLLLFVMAFAIASPAVAQGGGVDNCKNSPENPTAILALAGSAGAMLMAARSRFRRK